MASSGPWWKRWNLPTQNFTLEFMQPSRRFSRILCQRVLKRLKTHEEAQDATSEHYVGCEVDLAIRDTHKHKEIDLNEVISEFAGKKGRRLALSF